MAMGNQEELTVELDSELLEQMRERLAPCGMKPEELIAAFIHWCVDNPERAKRILLKWKAELLQEEPTEEPTKEEDGGHDDD